VGCVRYFAHQGRKKEGRRVTTSPASFIKKGGRKEILPGSSLPPKGKKEKGGTKRHKGI